MNIDELKQTGKYDSDALDDIVKAANDRDEDWALIPYEMFKQENPESVKLDSGAEYPEDMIPYILDFNEHQMQEEVHQDILEHLLKIGDVIDDDEDIYWTQAGNANVTSLKEIGYTIEAIEVYW